ncbi:hypothetical protein SAMN04488693_1346 [Arthrobacter subterraneus]|uniref:Uncharacterized protein n=1 Tax=Arthrobacter subterraneus TaxID=335973 RepID=A0A1G8PHV9_9MICC|nr:hypothetical protein [Arthrobacter subterraneus]SDI92099.1 hypothetical protein SAMN04488693_1346 [Arthrobacter subterraneus]
MNNNTDFVHSAHQVAYEPPGSAVEEALTQAMPLGAALIGPVNFTWDRPSSDLWPDD